MGLARLVLFVWSCRSAFTKLQESPRLEGPGSLEDLKVASLGLKGFKSVGLM